MEAITLSLNSLRKENDNRVEEISKLAQRVGCTGEIETDRDGVNLGFTNDSSTDDEEVQAQERIRERNEQISQRLKQRHHLPTLYSEEEEKIIAKDAIETIRTLNGRDDMGIEKFIKCVKKAKGRCSQQSLLLDFILAKRISENAERAIRYSTITTYD